MLVPIVSFIYLLTYSMVQSPSWEAYWFVASQEIPHISRNPKVHYRNHKRPPPVSILGQPNPVHIPTSHLMEIHPNIIHTSTPRSPQWSPSLRFPHQDPIHTPFLTHSRHMPGPSLLYNYFIFRATWYLGLSNWVMAVSDSISSVLIQSFCLQHFSSWRHLHKYIYQFLTMPYQTTLFSGHNSLFVSGGLRVHTSSRRPDVLTEVPKFSSAQSKRITAWYLELSHYHLYSLPFSPLFTVYPLIWLYIDWSIGTALEWGVKWKINIYINIFSALYEEYFIY